MASGVASSDGAAGIIASVDEYVRTSAPDVGVLKCDLRNAFNSAPRAPILDAIAEHFPILLAYAICVLCCACFLLYGLFVLLSTLGVQQGDPLGPILFAVGLSEIGRAHV